MSSYLKGEFISEDEGETWTMRERRPRSPVSDGNEFSPIRRMHNVVFSPNYAKDGTIFTVRPGTGSSSPRIAAHWTQIVVSPPPPDRRYASS